MDARGAAESESGSAFSAAPVGEDVDFRLPVDRKNLLKTGCLAEAGPAAEASPEAGFRRDIAGQGVTAQGPGRAETRARTLTHSSPASAGAST